MDRSRWVAVALWIGVIATVFLMQGCFFIFIPGSVVAAVSDGITGAEGRHCLAKTAKVGDVILIPGGGTATVKSLSGPSVRCTDPIRPIRALLVFDGADDATSASGIVR